MRLEKAVRYRELVLFIKGYCLTPKKLHHTSLSEYFKKHNSRLWTQTTQIIRLKIERGSGPQMKMGWRPWPNKTIFLCQERAYKSQFQWSWSQQNWRSKVTWHHRCSSIAIDHLARVEEYKKRQRLDYRGNANWRLGGGSGQGKCVCVYQKKSSYITRNPNAISWHGEIAQLHNNSFISSSRVISKCSRLNKMEQH